MNARIQELIAAGEDRKIEFKTARKALNRDLYETICAFLNRDDGHDPVMVEDNIFRLILPLVGTPSDDGKKKTSGKMAGKVAGKILKAMRQNPAITIPELTVQIMVSQRSIERNIKKLQESGSLRRVGPSRGGHWEVLS